ncbi:hypothetical protein ANO11243_044180 [Dothideomycetidae sp. 11243]|nr:hypothetical protein ANO11243_044180 [fungal sp. No.11243]
MVAKGESLIAGRICWVKQNGLFVPTLRAGFSVVGRQTSTPFDGIGSDSPGWFGALSGLGFEIQNPGGQRSHVRYETNEREEKPSQILEWTFLDAIERSRASTVTYGMGRHARSHVAIDIRLNANDGTGVRTPSVRQQNGQYKQSSNAAGRLAWRLHVRAPVDPSRTGLKTNKLL